MGPSTGGVRGFTVLTSETPPQRETPQAIAPAPFRISSHPIAAAVLLGCQVSYLAIGLDAIASPCRDKLCLSSPPSLSVSAPPIPPVARASLLVSFRSSHSSLDVSAPPFCDRGEEARERFTAISRPSDFCRKSRRTSSPPRNFSVKIYPSHTPSVQYQSQQYLTSLHTFHAASVSGRSQVYVVSAKPPEEHES